MLTEEEFVDATALRRRGWTISAIARHLGRDRKTVRAYLEGGASRASAGAAPDPFEPFEPYVRERLADDPHCGGRCCTTRSSRSATRAATSPSYVSCAGAGCARAARPAPGVGPGHHRDRPPPGEEIQWDWFERRRRPGAGRRICWSGRCPTRAGCAA